MAIGRTNAQGVQGDYIFKYNGSFTIDGEYKTTPTGFIIPKGNFVMKLLTSGTFTLKRAKANVEVFAVGGGGGGRGWYWNDYGGYYAAGGAGAGGCRRTSIVSLLNRTDYPVVIGAGGSPGSGGGDKGSAAGNGGATSAFGVSAPGGGGATFPEYAGGTNVDGTGKGADGGWSPPQGHDGTDGGYAFNDSSYGYRYGAGGATPGVYSVGTPGLDGAGHARGGSGAVNSGSGGGGNNRDGYPGGTGGNTWGGSGGSGIVIIRNAR